MVKAIGQDKLVRKLKLMPKFAKEEIRAALAKGADEIVLLARSLAPKDSGALARSIGWSWGAAPKGSMVLAKANAGDLSLVVFAGSDEAYYARWLEFGTQKMQAHPYFFVSYRALRKRTKSRISRATTKAARKVAAS
ncbi:phage protein, HK97 gp10 family [Phyllobacterium sp. CL33Tsu]|uniref:HK97-gp10 family putative phage morphogenesis protein n=1 Tax=Phyllobacterium sp. CL33Tsu TaxID=1798191 RepID=UPI0008E887B0|nr:HK97-gp10 family putative phage morphogenesis protein [Phyllobacterium sp. CL33Tsu]SFJ54982.1 phage protein, HK97 gp10 family [Phyllobacterium sp. CL33Tsu]